MRDWTNLRPLPGWWRHEPGRGITATVLTVATTWAALDAVRHGEPWHAALYGLTWALAAGMLGGWIGAALSGPPRDPVAEVLRHLLAIPGPHYAIPIMRATRLSSGRIYVALAELEQAGVVASHREPDPGNRPARRGYLVPASQVARARALLSMPEPRNWRTLLAEDVRHG